MNTEPMIDNGQRFEDTTKREMIDGQWTAIHQNDAGRSSDVEPGDEFDRRLQQRDKFTVLGTYDGTASHQSSLPVEALFDDGVNGPSCRDRIGVRVVVHQHDKIIVGFQNLQQTYRTGLACFAFRCVHRVHLMNCRSSLDIRPHRD